MKRFLVCVFALVMLIPALVIARAEAADVPDFRQIAGRHVTFANHVPWSNPTSYDRFYHYRCSVDLEENFAEQFVELVQSDGLFDLIAYDERGYSNNDIQEWIFIYTGPKKRVPTFSTFGNDPYKAHLTVEKHQNFKSGVTEFTIRVAARLTYGGDD